MVVDDEPLANERLEGLLHPREEFELTAVCSGGEQAVQAILEQSPDLVFLDIQMPEVDGFEVLRRLPADRRPVIIFVTAYNQFAIEAFEFAALDYLLKPFSDNRFETALNRARQQIQRSRHDELNEAVDQLLNRIAHPENPPTRLALRTPERTLFLDFAEINWIGSARNYVEVHAGAKQHLVRETLRVMERRLPENQFFKINRSTIVNVDKIREIAPLGNGLHVVKLQNGIKLPPTRCHDALLQRMTAAGN